MQEAEIEKLRSDVTGYKSGIKEVKAKHKIDLSTNMIR